MLFLTHVLASIFRATSHNDSKTLCLIGPNVLAKLLAGGWG